MLAHCEAQIRRRRVRGKGQRERQLHRRAIGLLPSRAKSNTSNSRFRRANIRASSAAFLAVEDQHRKPFALREEVAIEGAE